VYWQDSAVQDGWNEEHELSGLADVATTGYVVKRTPHTIAVAGSVADGDQLGEVMTIPMSCVRRIERLR
jgi:hypothetical protein